MSAPGRFRSTRERRLWVLVGLVVAAIYSTLWLTTAFPGLLYEQWMAAVAFLAGMALTGAAVLTQGLRWRPRGHEIGIAVGLAAVYGMFLVRLTTIPERSHLIEYTVLAILIREALGERARHDTRVRVVPLLAFLLTTVIGAIDEALQLIVPHRVFDPVDILFNTLAAAFAVVSMELLGWARRRWTRGADAA